MTEIDEKVKDIKSRIKQYEMNVVNSKIFKMLTTKDRLGLLELANIIVIQRLEKLEKQIRSLGFISLMNICAYISLIIWILK